MSVKASIISSCYNHGKYISEMLDSVLKQTFMDFEVIIVNDGSTDDTASILDRIEHKKINVFHTKNHGPAHARNLAISHAVGEIIMNLDADDKIAPEFFKKCIKVLDTRANVGIVYSDVEFFGARTGHFELEDYSLKSMLFENRIVANACFRRSDWEMTEGYSDEMIHGLEDFDFWLSILELGREVHKIEEPLVFYRTYENPEESRSGRRKKNQLKVQEAMIQVFQRHKELYKKIPEAWGYFSTIENQFYATLSSSELIKKYKQNMTEPIFTIVTPTNKRPVLLKRAINSVLSQSFKNFEQIIVDDANDPATAQVVAEFKNEKLRYYAHEKKHGAAGAYNTGIKLARGRFINFLDDDDEYLPGILEKIHQTFTGSKNKIGFVWTGVTRVKDTEKGEETLITQVWPAKFDTREYGLMVSTAIGNGFGLSVRMECIDEIGYYDESLMIGEDTDFMIRLSARYDFLTVPEVMVKIHHHGDTQLTSEKYYDMRRQCYMQILERHFNFLSKHWDAFYIHSKACVNLSYTLKKKKAGRMTLWALIRKYPSKWIIYADFVCYELFGVDYKTWRAEKK